jgi:hypothetical protein
MMSRVSGSWTRSRNKRLQVPPQGWVIGNQDEIVGRHLQRFAPADRDRSGRSGRWDDLPWQRFLGRWKLPGRA